MSVTIELTDALAEKLQSRAEAQKLSIEELALSILNDIADFYPTPEEVVAEIKATPPNPANILPASGSLAEALKNAPDDPRFNLESWNKEWAAVEKEMKAVTRANDFAEGRI